MEKHISVQATSSGDENVHQTLVLLAGRLYTGIQVALIDPYQIKDSMETIAFNILPVADLPYSPLKHGLSSFEKPSVQLIGVRLVWDNDSKDQVMSDPKALQALYKQAEEEDYHLAQIGAMRYVELLEEEEESFE